MAAKDPEKITGKDWEAEVGNRSFKHEGIRNEFYDKLARLKLHVETSPDGILDNPAASGLKTFEELKTSPEFSRVVNKEGKTYETGKGWTLIECLHSYFKNNVGITDAKLRSREVALTLYHLTQQKDTSGRSINVDYLNAKWKVEIKGGQLFIYDKKGEAVVDGANVRKPGTASPLAPASGPLSALALTPAALGTESERFLARVRERSKNTEALDKKITHVREALTVAKQKIDGMIDSAPPEQIAATSNAWVAWNKEGILQEDVYADLRKTLQGYLGAGNREPRQLWRTEMASYISSKLQASSRTDKSEVMERVMGAQIVTEFEDDPNEALKTSMNLDEKIKKLSVRKDIGQKMAKSDTSGGLDSIGTLFSGYSVKEIKIVVGGEFMALPIDQAEKFTFMRMILDEKENRIYAQMQNGCRGNLVIMELLPPSTTAPAPGPGTGPGRPPVALPAAPLPGPVGPTKPKAAPPGATPPASPAAAPPSAPPAAPPTVPAPTPASGIGPGRLPVAPPVAPTPGPVGPGKSKPAPAPAVAPPTAPPPGPVGPGRPPVAPAPAPPSAPLPAPGVGPRKPAATPPPAPGIGPGRPSSAPRVVPPPAPPAAPPTAPAPTPGVGPGKPPVAPPPGPVGPGKPKPAPSSAAPPAAPPVAPAPAPLPSPGVGPGRPPVTPLPGPVGPGRPPMALTPAPGIGPGKQPEVAPPPAAGIGPVRPKAAPPGAVPPLPRAEPDEGAPTRPPQ